MLAFVLLLWIVCVATCFLYESSVELFMCAAVRYSWEADYDQERKLLRLTGGQDLPCAAYSALYVRDVYPRLAKAVMSCTCHKVLLMGTPGCGKTMFGLYFMWTLACSNKPFIYEKVRGGTRLFHDGQVYELADHSPSAISSALERSPDTWYIVDGMTPSFESHVHHTLLITSPRREVWYHWHKSGSCARYVMPVWTWEEILSCRDVCYPHLVEGQGIEGGVTFSKDLYDKWGGVPRFLLEKLLVSDHAELEDTLNQAQATDLIFFAVKGQEVDVKQEPCHRLVHIIPGDDLQHLQYDFASDYVRGRLMAKFIKESESQLMKLVNRLQGVPYAAALYGHMFESLSHHVLSRGGTFDAKRLDQSDSTNKFVLPQSPTETFTSWSELQPYAMNCYYVPESPNLVSVDAAEDHMCFQATVSTKHPVRADGIDAWLRAVPDDGQPNRLVFVVPRHIFDSFTCQPYHTKGKTVVTVGCPNVEQWVMTWQTEHDNIFDEHFKKARLET